MDNTSDSDKPVSTPQQAALNLEMNANDNATIAVEVADDSRNHVFSNVGSLQACTQQIFDKE